MILDTDVILRQARKIAELEFKAERSSVAYDCLLADIRDANSRKAQLKEILDLICRLVNHNPHGCYKSLPDIVETALQWGKSD
jgi:hypothetical protein